MSRPDLGLLTKRQVLDALVEINPEYNRAKLARSSRDCLLEAHRAKLLAHFMAHKCSNGASDTTDNDLQRSDPAR